MKSGKLFCNPLIAIGRSSRRAEAFHTRVVKHYPDNCGMTRILVEAVLDATIAEIEVSAHATKRSRQPYLVGFTST